MQKFIHLTSENDIEGMVNGWIKENAGYRITSVSATSYGFLRHAFLLIESKEGFNKGEDSERLDNH